MAMYQSYQHFQVPHQTPHQRPQQTPHQTPMTAQQQSQFQFHPQPQQHAPSYHATPAYHYPPPPQSAYSPSSTSSVVSTVLATAVGIEQQQQSGNVKQWKVPVGLASSSGSPTKTAELMFTVTTSGSEHARLIQLRLDNPSDPSFLFTAEITASNFPALPRVTLDTFVERLEQHLRDVLSGHGRVVQHSHECVKVCQFVLEPNAYGLHELRLLMQSATDDLLSIWTLPFQPASDAQAKQFTLEAWTSERKWREELLERVHDLEQEGASKRHQLQQLSVELQQLTIEQQSVLKEHKVKSERDLLDKDKHHTTEMHAAMAEQASAHHAALSEQVTKCAHLEAELKTTRKDLSVCDAEKNTLANDLAALRYQHEHLLTTSQAEAAKLRSTNAQLQADLRQAIDLTAKQTTDLATLQREKDQFEAACSANDKYLSRLQEGGDKDKAAQKMLEAHVADLQAKQAELMTKNKELCDKIAVLEPHLAKETKYLIRTEQEYLKKKESEKALKEELKEQAHAMNGLQRDLAHLQEDKQRLESSLAESKESVLKTEKQLRDSLASFEALSNQYTTKDIARLPGVGATTTSTYQPISFTSSLHHTSSYQPNSSSLTPMPFVPTRGNATLDFGSPISPGAAPSVHHAALRPTNSNSVTNLSVAHMSEATRRCLAESHAAQRSQPPPMSQQQMPMRTPLGSLTSHHLNQPSSHQQQTASKLAGGRSDVLSTYAPPAGLFNSHVR